MTVGLTPVDDAPAHAFVDQVVDGSVRSAAVRNTELAQARDERVELGVAHAEAVVHHREVAVGLIEVESQRVADVDRGEGANS